MSLHGVATVRILGSRRSTRKLLQHWAEPSRDDRMFFCQREAADTAIFLTEVAGRRNGYPDWRERLEPENDEHNAGLPRIALKMIVARIGSAPQ